MRKSVRQTGTAPQPSPKSAKKAPPLFDCVFHVSITSIPNINTHVLHWSDVFSRRSWTPSFLSLMVAVVATVVQAVLYFIRQWQERLTLASVNAPQPYLPVTSNMILPLVYSELSRHTLLCRSSPPGTYPTNGGCIEIHDWVTPSGRAPWQLLSNRSSTVTYPHNMASMLELPDLPAELAALPLCNNLS